MRALLLFALCLPAFAGYASYRTITIDHTQAGATDTSNFVFPFRTSTTLNGAIDATQTNVTVYNGQLIVNGDTIKVQSEHMLVGSGGGTASLTVTRHTDGTSAATHADKIQVTNIFLATVANGGNLTSSSGYDAVFFSDVTCSTPLNFELEDYNATGDASWHVQIPTLSHTADNVVYLCHGNSAVTTYQGNNTATWDTNFKRVYHMSSTANTTDSTGNNNLNTTATAISHLPLMDGGSTTTAQTGGTAAGLVYGSSARTMEVWVNNTSCAVTETLLEYGTTTSGQWQGAVMTCGSGNINYSSFGDDLSITGGWSFVADPDWNYFVFIYDGTKAYIYKDAVLLNAGGTSKTWSTVSNRAFDINQQAALFNHDEVRYSNVARTADYITATWNAYKVASTFFTISGETAISNGVRHRSSVY